MCMRPSEPTHSTSLYAVSRYILKPKSQSLRIRRLHRRRRLRKDGLTREMEMSNLRLYMENQSIIEENQKLRNRALLLHLENQALLLQLQTKLQQ